jgi:hypothetical protein
VIRLRNIPAATRADARERPDGANPDSELLVTGRWRTGTLGGPLGKQPLKELGFFAQSLYIHR